MEFSLDLRDFSEEIYEEVENFSEGLYGHECVINANDIDEAAEKFSLKLKQFFRDRLIQVD